MDYADPQWLMELLGEHLEEMNRHFADNGLHPCAQAAGGVGHINSPYTRTRVPAAGKQGGTQVGSTVLDSATALMMLKSYFSQIFGGIGSVILVGKKETLVGDGITAHFDEIKHYYSGTSEYSALPAHIKKAGGM